MVMKGTYRNADFEFICPIIPPNESLFLRIDALANDLSP